MTLNDLLGTGSFVLHSRHFSIQLMRYTTLITSVESILLFPAL